MEESHPAIIDKETWEAVQFERYLQKSMDCISMIMLITITRLQGKLYVAVAIIHLAGRCGIQMMKGLEDLFTMLYIESLTILSLSLHKIDRLSVKS